MGVVYRFYVQMDGTTYGPYSAKAMRDFELLDDLLVTEESMNCQWLPASRFDFEDMAIKEELLQNDDSFTNSSANTQRDGRPNYIVNPDGTVTYTTPQQTASNNPSPAEVMNQLEKWNWGAFFFNWLWAVCNGIYWPLLMIVFNFIPIWGSLVSLIGCIYLGIKGN